MFWQLSLFRVGVVRRLPRQLVCTRLFFFSHESVGTSLRRKLPIEICQMFMDLMPWDSNLTGLITTRSTYHEIKSHGINYHQINLSWDPNLTGLITTISTYHEIKSHEINSHEINIKIMRFRKKCIPVRLFYEKHDFVGMNWVNLVEIDIATSWP